MSDEAVSSTDLDHLALPAVLVVGDAVLDEYLFGTATRLSREAPVPVLELTRRLLLPGGAANPAHNMAALGAPVALAAMIGADEDGRCLRDLLAGAGVDPRCLLIDPARPTTVKTRIVAEGLLRFPQQVARIDRIRRGAPPPSVATALDTLLGAEVGRVAAVLCSDYLSGLLTAELTTRLVALCREGGVLLTVDAQGELGKYRGVDLLRCNAQEAAGHLGRPLVGEDDFRAALGAMLVDLDVGLLVVTRGEEGLSLRGREVPYTHLPARRVEVADTTGAGDTFIAVMTLALATGIAPVGAAALANVAAGLVVRRFGNAVLTLDELRVEWAGAREWHDSSRP
ncbi:MAG: ADP-heptose synthase / D-glycero-beta-D-manno-heptose 7-phosphate kinase [uncultured Thermomicrobiales bacterium]|uniref:ADP-heptose synthase / D-glycero-beta-D-manno-heptose 7-phosphate kinase n=1 Tax=uncultured Thermomicrobiales bacterium TaxID=1645740 RepID=A0A6J4V6J7_9BACT|nr:MAG: ADP-heptose synthase / D-glycero-beta-D-manno-heptose 7-phosphate kinase [uncultured Thermomicrobiales bacterium]